MRAYQRAGSAKPVDWARNAEARLSPRETVAPAVLGLSRSSLPVMRGETPGVGSTRLVGRSTKSTESSAAVV